jgi:hypothetical protein
METGPSPVRTWAQGLVASSPRPERLALWHATATTMVGNYRRTRPPRDILIWTLIGQSTSPSRASPLSRCHARTQARLMVTCLFKTNLSVLPSHLSLWIISSPPAKATTLETSTIRLKPNMLCFRLPRPRGSSVPMRRRIHQAGASLHKIELTARSLTRTKSSILKTEAPVWMVL